MFGLKDQRVNSLGFTGFWQFLSHILWLVGWVFCFGGYFLYFNDHLKKKTFWFGLYKATGQSMWTHRRDFFPFLLRNKINRYTENHSKITEKCYTKSSPILINILRNNRYRELNTLWRHLQFPQQQSRVAKISEITGIKIFFIPLRNHNSYKV